jgi:hypothetical protein
VGGAAAIRRRRPHCFGGSQNHPRIVSHLGGMEEHIKRGVAVSIDGRIWRDLWDTELPKDAEIYLLPRIPGG